MQITFEDKTGQFIALSTFEERSIPKSAGFQWDSGARRWSTRSAEKAARLEKYADAKAKQRLLEMSGPDGAARPKSGASLTWNADRSRYEWRADKEMNELPKTAGFRWDPGMVVWHSADPAAANKLVTYADDATKARLGRAIEARTQAIEASRQASADAELPCPEGLKYLPYQTAGILAALNRPNAYFGDEMGLGKEQPLTARILTPTGWRVMGDMKAGTSVIGRDGRVHVVTGVYPQGVKPAWRVHFSDGTWAECGAEHLWCVQDSNRRRRNDSWAVIPLRDMLAAGLRYRNGTAKWRIPLMEPAEMSTTALDMPAYLMGVLLGDGYLTGTTVTFSCPPAKAAVLERVRAELGGDQDVSGPTASDQYHLKGTVWRHNPLLAAVRAYGMNVGSKEKFIPAPAFTASAQDRLDLLRGLMDTDGSAHKGRTTFHTCSPRLAEDVAELTRSLGGVGIIRRYDRSDEGKPVEWQVNVRLPLCPFTLERKAAHWKPPVRCHGKYIVDAEYIGHVPQQCIAVSAPDHLYVTDGYNVTHNTIQAIGTFNADPEAKTMLVIAPASLKINWQREIEKWSTKPVKVGIANGKKFPDDTHNVVVINYENVGKHRQIIDARQWDVMVCDESHYLKNEKAQRTRSILGGFDKKTRVTDPGIKSRRTIMMTGTPIPNRPKELWTTVKRLDPEGLGQNFMGFAKRYCGAIQTEWGWKFDGSSNLGELQDKLRASIMIRRTKKDVLTELPPKIRQVMPLEADRSTQKLIEKQNEVAGGIDARKAEIARLRAAGGAGFEDEVARLQDLSMADFTEMSRLRHEIAVAKIPAVIDHIKESLESGSNKIIVFAHHKDVVKAIKDEFGKSAVQITGETPNDQRQAAVDRFQTDPDCRVFVGNIRAAGVGLTLTASSHVVMAELDWTPGNVSQAEDRAHRIGQTDSVLVQHLVFDGSLDARLARTMVKKQDVADRALDRQDPEAERAEQARITALIEQTERAATARTPDQEREIRESIEAAEQVAAVSVAEREERDHKEAEAQTQITPEQIAQVHQNLRSLENVCDYAHEQDGAGFNAADANFGHYLAGKDDLSAVQAIEARTMLVKYKRQLGDEAVKSMFGRGQAVQADGPAAGLAALERRTGLDPAKATPLPAKRQPVEQGMEL